MSVNNKENKVNWFTRILIIILSSLIVSMIIYNFFVAQKGIIVNELLLLLALLILLILSEAFDNLSFGKILSLSNNVSEKKKEITEIKKEKNDLLNLLVSNINVQNQSQQVGISASELKDIIQIIKADPEMVEEETEEKENEYSEKTSSEKTVYKRIDFRKFERLVSDKFITDNNLQKYILKEQIQLASNDPISSRSPIIDGYIETEDLDIFIEIKRSRSSMMLRESLYQRLMNIYYYRQVKKINTQLVLLLVSFPNDEKNYRVNENIERDFAPAINKGLLKIYNIKLNAEEEAQVYKQI